MSGITRPSKRERFLGCLLGHAVGDATGAPLEGMPGDAIWYDIGGARNWVRSPSVEELTYTDDTQMTIAVADVLVSKGRIEEAALCEAFVSHYEPGRGYGQGARRIIEAMASGDDWRTLAATIFPGGSLGNGAAMRAAPVGLLFHDDLDRVGFEAAASARPTHLHPIGIDGAVLIAVAVAIVTRDGAFDQPTFYAELLRQAATEEFRHQIERAATWHPTDPVGLFGSSLPAHESVVTAIACFAGSPDSYENVISSAIALGNDTDTVAAMAGAISGAYLGVGAVPGDLLRRLENGPRGRQHITDLAGRLFDRYTTGAGTMAS